MYNSKVSHIFVLCVIWQIGSKSPQINVKIARDKVTNKWLTNHPRSVWWINNDRLADFCRIPSGDKVHKTTILGKFFPRRLNFCERCAGLSCQNV